MRTIGGVPQRYYYSKVSRTPWYKARNCTKVSAPPSCNGLRGRFLAWCADHRNAQSLRAIPMGGSMTSAMSMEVTLAKKSLTEEPIGLAPCNGPSLAMIGPTTGYFSPNADVCPSPSRFHPPAASSSVLPGPVPPHRPRLFYLPVPFHPLLPLPESCRGFDEQVHAKTPNTGLAATQRSHLCRQHNIP